MSNTQPPRRPSSVGETAVFGALHNSRDSICVQGPLHAQASSSPPSTSPPGLPSTMATIFSDSAPSKELHLSSPLTVLGDTTALQWNPHYELHPFPRLDQHDLDLSSASHYTPGPTAGFNYIPDASPYDPSYRPIYPSSLDVSSSCPRFVTGLGLSDSTADIDLKNSYPPSAYVFQPPPPTSQSEMDSRDQSHYHQLWTSSDVSEHQHISHVKMEDSVNFSSTFGSRTSTRCSTPQEELPLAQGDFKNACVGAGLVDDSAIDREQPYAQLIYRALMEAPNHTMVLRDIYNWFKENTDKAADKETKGWQNSIRHNLSMNGAFVKVDYPSDETKKGFMWKLTDEAIRDGVKSTTRFRSKQPNKRAQRSQQPLPQRQASGARGGQAARRSAKLRRSQRVGEVRSHRSIPYVSRSGPTSYPAFDSGAMVSMSYPASPYYGSEMDCAHLINQDDFGSSIHSPGLLGFSPHSQSPLPQDLLYADTAFMLSHDLTDPILYSSGDGSSSPSCSEPLTPVFVDDSDVNTKAKVDSTDRWEDVITNYQG